MIVLKFNRKNSYLKSSRIIVEVPLLDAQKIGNDSFIAKTPDDLVNATKIILPGVGSFDYGMKNLRNLGFCDFCWCRIIII